jgi:bifunctional NMN adenylyltransferase/nudix hydrolase
MGRPWTDKEKRHEVAVVIGRFQPLHYGHIYNIDKGLEIAKKVLILVGSAYNSVSPKNPFTFEQRMKMINDYYFSSKYRDKIVIAPLADNLYEENQWITDVQDFVYEQETDDVVLIGHEKDKSSYYLKAFPQWKFFETGKWPVKDSSVDATKIRELYFEHDLRYVSGVVPTSVYSFLEWFSTTQEYSNIRDEYNFLVDYKNSWASSPFPPTFSTVDSIVIQSGHILLIKRKEHPGKELYALPGGFIGQTERQIDAAIRELREETKLKVPVPVLRGSITKEKTFDHPNRSQRGRTITQAFLFQLKNDEELPKVKGSDDAKEAMWVPLIELYNRESLMYEDHYYIIRKMIDNE